LKILCVVLVLLSVGAVSGAQEQPPSLQIGTVKVWLGMPKSEVERQFHIDLELSKTTENSWMVGLMAGHREARVDFWNGVVTSVTKFWMLSQSDGAEAVLGAVDSLTRQGHRMCVMSHSTSHAPGVRNEIATITCGATALVVRKMEFTPTDTSPNTGPVYMVEEQIGSSEKSALDLQ
jgi:hypothetical protein